VTVGIIEGIAEQAIGAFGHQPDRAQSEQRMILPGAAWSST